MSDAAAGRGVMRDRGRRCARGLSQRARSTHRPPLEQRLGVYRFSEHVDRPAARGARRIDIEGQLRRVRRHGHGRSASGSLSARHARSRTPNPFTYDCGGVTLSFDRRDPIGRAMYSVVLTVTGTRQVCVRYATDATGRRYCAEQRTEATQRQVTQTGYLRPIRPRADRCPDFGDAIAEPSAIMLCVVAACRPRWRTSPVTGRRPARNVSILRARHGRRRRAGDDRHRRGGRGARRLGDGRCASGTVPARRAHGESAAIHLPVRQRHAVLRSTRSSLALELHGHARAATQSRQVCARYATDVGGRSTCAEFRTETTQHLVKRSGQLRLLRAP